MTSRRLSLSWITLQFNSLENVENHDGNCVVSNTNMHVFLPECDGVSTEAGFSGWAGKRVGSEGALSSGTGGRTEETGDSNSPWGDWEQRTTAQ